ncbi:MAG: AsmA-like C-terminal region-containing protein [Azonexus sp.]
MDANLIYAKTPIGDEAVRQSTRVVQRNLRMVLVQVDGKMSVEELSNKIGNPRLVQAALRELEEGGYIAPALVAASVWAEARKAAQAAGQSDATEPLSEFSVFGPISGLGGDSRMSASAASAASNFSSFGKPILPTRNGTPNSPFRPAVTPPDLSAPQAQGGERTSSAIALRRMAWGLVAGLVLAIATLVLYPYDRFKPAIEAAASDFAGVPVRVGQVDMAFFPVPHLRLRNLRMGQAGEGSVAEVRVGSPWALLGAAPFTVEHIHVRGARLSSRQVVSLPFFRPEAAKPAVLTVGKVQIEQSGIVLAEGVGLQDAFGELSFRPDARLERASLESADRSLRIEAQPGPLGIALNIEGRAWQPIGASATFASLQAKGVLQADKLLIQNIDTTFLGGILRGNWLLDWHGGLAMAGDASLSRIDARKLAAAFAPSLRLEGELSGTLRVRSTGADWAVLWRNVEAVLDAEVTRGAVHGVDLGEAARRNGVSEVRAGTTKFDRLRATVNVTPNQVISKDLRLEAGMMTASGQFVARADGQVDGNMTVALQTSVSSLRVPVQIYGALPDLTAIGRK